MRGFRFLGMTMALAMAVAMVAFASPGYAKDLGYVRVTTATSYHDFSIPYLSFLSAPAAYCTVRLSTADGGTVLTKQTYRYSAPRSISAVYATTQAGWRSGRLRKLSVG